MLEKLCITAGTCMVCTRHLCTDHSAHVRVLRVLRVLGGEQKIKKEYFVSEPVHTTVVVYYKVDRFKMHSLATIASVPSAYRGR